MGPVDLVFTIASFLFTILILTYLVMGDNPFFRFATYTFIGIAAAYLVVVTLNQVIWPQLIRPLLVGSMDERILLAFPLAASLFLLAKLFPSMSRLGNPSMAYVVGIGAAVTIGGTLFGTLFPQTAATIQLFDLNASTVRGATPGLGIGATLLDGVFILVGTITSLAFFHFGARKCADQTPQRPPLVEALARVGQYFIAITFGALFAGVYMAALSALVERIAFLLNFRL
jgi:hypothetical protein